MTFIFLNVVIFVIISSSDVIYLLLKEKDHSRRWSPLKVVYRAVLFGKVEQTCTFIGVTFGFNSLSSILDLFVIPRQVC